MMKNPIKIIRNLNLYLSRKRIKSNRVKMAQEFESFTRKYAGKSEDSFKFCRDEIYNR